MFLLKWACLFIIGFNYLECASFIPGNVLPITTIRTSPPLIHSVPGSAGKINDNDYWDSDDFVPYKNDRHDSFDWKLLKEVLQKEQSNVIISPFSIKLVLALLYEAAGSGSNTQKELSTILPELQSEKLIRDVFQKSSRSLNQESSYYNINFATKLFFDSLIEPRQRYSAIAKTYYNAEIERLNFQDTKTSSDLINRWCKNVTEGHLEHIVTQDNMQNVVLLMVNAIYFDGLWRRSFSNETELHPFFVQSSEQINAEYMTQTDSFYYFDSPKLNAKILRLPYRGKKFSMTVIVPNAKGSLDELIREFNRDKLSRIQWLMDEMKDVIETLGIRDIFTSNASLPGIDRGMTVENQLQVSSIIQKAGITLHEKGSIAYAATEVEIVNKFGGAPEEFKADRPFVFLIEDETTGTLLFAGKVVDPTK